MSLVLKEVKDGVAIIRMNNPKTMNGLDMNMTQAVYDAVTEAGADDNVKVIILAGEGKGFCGGGNLANMYEKIKDGGKFDPAESKPNMNRLAELACYMREVPKPVITVVHGAAAGAGAGLAAAGAGAGFVSALGAGLASALGAGSVASSTGRENASSGVASTRLKS